MKRTPIKNLIVFGLLYFVSSLSIAQNITIPRLPAGDSIIIISSVTINSPFTNVPSQVSKQHTISGTNFSNVLSNDPKTLAANDPTITPVVTVSGSDLSIINSDSPDPVIAGNNITYTITLSNLDATTPAATVAVTDVLPAGVTFVSLSAPAGWSATTPAVGANGTVTITKASLANSDGLQTFTLVVNVGAATANGTVISNTAIVTTTTTESNSANNSATATATVNAPAITSNASDYFGTRQSGNWNDVNTWESSPVADFSSGVVNPATLTPNSTANTITIRNTHLVTVTANVTTDQTIVKGGGILTVASGATLTVNGNGLTLQSNASGTAMIGNSAGTITGNVTVERLISAVSNRSAWRFLTAPLTGTGSIFDTWQNGGVYTPGIGTTITGPNYSGAGTTGNPVPNATTGLDYLTAAPSLYTFNAATQNIDAVTNTKTTLLTDPTGNKGYYIFINGDRQSAWGAPNQTTLSATGSLLMGTKNFVTSAAANAITLIGNPYASTVDLDKFITDNASSNVKPNYYYWDPYLTGSYGVGGYVTVTYPGPIITPAAANETKFLQSGQAMFVETKSSGGAGSVTFNEAQKDPTSVNNIFRIQSAPADNISVNLNVVSGGASILVDGITASFDNSYSAKVDDHDATKFQNPGESIAFMRDNKAFAVERLPLNSETILNLNLYRLKQNTTYQFEIMPSITTPGLTAYLTDNYLKTTTTVDLSKPTIVNFTVKNEAASTGANRFNISFAKPAMVLAGKDGISVYPNPVTDGIISLRFNNIPQGIYKVKVMDNVGRTILARPVHHSGGSNTETIQLGKGVKGIYHIEVTRPNKSTFKSKVITY